MREIARGSYQHEKMMADASMERTLHYQAAAIWPKERVWFEAKGLHLHERVVDLGCGTGEISSRLAQSYAFREIVGVDLLQQNIDLAQSRHGHLAALRFERGDVNQPHFPDHYFDLSLNRHLIQVIPNPHAMLREMKRITKPGGVLYFLAEDYGMIHCTNVHSEPRWHRFQENLLDQGTDLMIGRKLPVMLRDLGLIDIDMTYLRIDSLNTERNILAGIFQNWCLGYAEFLAEHNQLDEKETRRHFQDHIDCVLDESEYLVWHVPVIAAVNPG